MSDGRSSAKASITGRMKKSCFLSSLRTPAPRAARTSPTKRERPATRVCPGVPRRHDMLLGDRKPKDAVRAATARTPISGSSITAHDAERLRGGRWVVERRRAIALARHYREFEGLSIGQIAQRLGGSAGEQDQGVLLRARRARRRGRSRSATKGCAAAAAPTRSRATQEATPTRIARSPSRRDPASVDPRAGHLGDAAVARALRPAAVILRLVAHPCPQARWGRASTPDESQCPTASVVGALFGTWASARTAAETSQSANSLKQHGRSRDVTRCPSQA